jgi:hypothetical protein
LHTVATTAPKVLLFAVILAAGYFVARVVRTAVTKVLLRTGFNTLVDKARLSHLLPGGYAHTLAAKLAYAAVLLVALQLAFGVFGPNPVSALITSVIAYIPRVVVALAIVVVAGILASHAKSLIYGAIGGLSYGRTVAQAASVGVVALGVVAALGQVGVAGAVTQPVLIAALATVSGILIVGVGGGLIKPAQQRWDDYLAFAEAELDNNNVDEEPVNEEPVEDEEDDRDFKVVSASVTLEREAE